MIRVKEFELEVATLVSCSLLWTSSSCGVPERCCNVVFKLVAASSLAMLGFFGMDRRFIVCCRCADKGLLRSAIVVSGFWDVVASSDAASAEA